MVQLIVGEKGKYKELIKLLNEVQDLEMKLVEKKVLKSFTINKIRRVSKDIMLIVNEFNNNVNYR